MRETLLIGLVFLFFLLQTHATTASEHVVGGNKGWDLYPELYFWPDGKHFKAGDVLIFKYNNPLFHVEAVNESQYINCNSEGQPKKIYSSGHDRVVLHKGLNYFICGGIDYCGYGMKIVVNATE
ncbi:Basic blue protein [Melia azedarach]|uniref:Basic blue protein n=1 Tax=Melia azedarach TaxID=155640 RepID=A0ACC1YFE6_MELAZ|nr:Basic blue protein [Melia azedarach]